MLSKPSKSGKRQRKHREDVVTLLERELGNHPTSDAYAQWVIKLLVKRRYKRYLGVTKSGLVRIDCIAM